jgi:hypothetical protein
LYLLARRIGIGEERFWHLSYRQLFRELVVAREKVERQHNRDTALAWRTAMLQRAKKIPGLKELLTAKKGRQSVSEMRDVLEMLSQRYGGKVQKRG